jgi:hypothetical protein
MVFFYVYQYFWQMTMCNFISRILIDSLVLINLICLVRPILTYNSEISFMDYVLVSYHMAKQRAILRNGNMDHFTFIDTCRTPFEKVHLIFCKHLLGTKKTSSNIGVWAELGINQDVYVGQGKLLTMIIAIPWITGVTLYWVLVTILSALTTRPENRLF